jgi:hypothetical protein
MRDYTKLERETMQFAAALAADDSQVERPVATTLEQRIAIGVIQARALECRHQAGEIALRIGLNQPFFRMYHSQLIERSHRLEQFGVQMARQYPPVDEPGEQPIGEQ